MNVLPRIMLYNIFSSKNLHILNIILNFVLVFGANHCRFLGAVLKIEHFQKRNMVTTVYINKKKRPTEVSRSLSRMKVHYLITTG